MGWNQPDIKSKFTQAEQDKILTTMKAGLVCSALIMAEYTATGVHRGNRSVDMEGEENIYQSPNYSEGYCGVFMASLAVISKDSAAAFLNNYNHANFMAELTARGLTSIKSKFDDLFAPVTVDNILYDGSTAAKKASFVEGYVNNIDNNDNASTARKFYRGLKLTDIIADPIKLTSALTIDCYDEIANEGAFVGQRGMAQELLGADASGQRSSLWYSCAGVINNTYSRFLVNDYGYWAASTQGTLKAQIDQLMKVGYSDIASKSWNGFWSSRNGSIVYDKMVDYSGKSWWQRVYDLARSMDYAKEYYMNDPFQDSNISSNPKWTSTGTWSFATTPTFTGITTRLDTVITTNATDQKAMLVSDFAGNDYELTFQTKITAFGAGGQIGLVGRYNDASNYYLVKYNKDLNTCDIIEVKNNVPTTLVSQALTLNLNTLYFFRVSFKGNAIQFFVNNSLKASIAGNAFLGGKIGLFTSNTSAMFDDVFVTKP